MKTVQEILATTYPDTGIIRRSENPKQGNVLNKGDVLWLHGAPKIGKTYLLIQSLWELAHGLPWLSTFEVVAPQRIGYYQVEVDEAMMQLRLQVFSWDKHLYIENDTLFKLDTAGKDQVCRDIVDYKLTGVAYDPFYRVHKGGENAKEDVEPTLDITAYIAHEYGVWQTFVHHDRKVGIDKNGQPVYTGSGESRGSGALLDFAGTIVSMVKRKDPITGQATGAKLAFEFRHAEPHDNIELVRAPESTHRWFIPAMQGDRTQTCIKAIITLKGGEIEHSELARIVHQEYLVGDDGLRNALGQLVEKNIIEEATDSTDKRKKVYKLKEN